MKIESAIKDYLLECEIKKYTWKTVRGFRTNLNVFIKFCKEDEIKDMDDVDFALVKRFLYWLVQKEYKGTYINSLLKTLKSFIQYCYDEDYGGFDTTKKKFVWTKEDVPVIMPFTPKDVRQLLSNCAGHDYLDIRDTAIITTLIETGIRAYELCCIRTQDVHEDYIVIVTPKNHKQRLVGITPVLKKALIRCERCKKSFFANKKIDEYYFLSVNGKQMTNSALQHLFKRRGEGIDDNKVRVSPHTCRHFFAVESLKQGRDLYSISQQLGHSDIKITSQYLRTLAQEDVIQIAKTSSVLMNMKE